MTTTDQTRAPKGRASRRRSEHARLAVVRAADDLLAERGFAAVTIKGIAARAGVAKQTIYRWWPSKVDVLLDSLLDDAGSQLTVPDTGPVVEGVRRYLHGLARFLAEEPAGKVLLALMGEAQHDPATARLVHERFLGPQREHERAMLQRGIDSGELPAGLDIDDVLDALSGPIFYRALTGQQSPQAFTDELVARWLPVERLSREGV